MKIITKEVKIEKRKKLEDIERALAIYGEPLRFAIVNTDKDYFYVESAFLSE